MADYECLFVGQLLINCWVFRNDLRKHQEPQDSLGSRDRESLYITLPSLPLTEHEAAQVYAVEHDGQEALQGDVDLVEGRQGGGEGAHDGHEHTGDDDPTPTVPDGGGAGWGGLRGE